MVCCIKFLFVYQVNFIRDYGETTGKFTAGLVTPDRAAVILVFPTATPVAKPAEDMVAIAVLELAQVTREEMSAFELSE